MITLTDTFNNRAISNHRTVKGAVLAMGKHARAVERRNGENHFVTYRIERDGIAVDQSEIDDAKIELGCW